MFRSNYSLSKKLLAITLALAMIMTLLPEFALPVSAASDSTGIFDVGSWQMISGYGENCYYTAAGNKENIFQVNNGANITITGVWGQSPDRPKEARLIEVNGTATITISSLGLSNSIYGRNYPCIWISRDATLHLIIEGTNTLTVGYGTGNADRAGILLRRNSNLHIDGGSGTLNVTGGDSWPGIGGNESNRSITINGANVNAYGGSRAAGIGGSNEEASGVIQINGGTVTAVGGGGAAGIGGGHGANSENITISNSTVKAEGGENGAGIGGGRGASAANITINSSTVEAIGGAAGNGWSGSSGAAGIGGGATILSFPSSYDWGNGGNVIINGGSVKATGRDGGAGIGGGGADTATPVANPYTGGNGGSLTVNDGTVTANSDSVYGAGVGGGRRSEHGGTVNINGGMLFATGGFFNKGIGSPYKGTNINVTGGMVITNGIGNEAGSESRSLNMNNQNGGGIVITNSITPETIGNRTGGALILTDSNTQTWYSDVEIRTACTLTNGNNLHVPGDRALTVSASGKLTNNGTIIDDSNNQNSIYWVQNNYLDTERLMGNRPVRTDHVFLADVTNGAQTARWRFENDILTILDQGKVTVEGPGIEARRILLNNRAEATLKNLTINLETVRENPISLAAGATAVINLEGESSLSVMPWRKAGIRVPAGADLTINGPGSLTANGSNFGAGIGSDFGEDSGDITINGGNITANGYIGGAGIGGGRRRIWDGEGGSGGAGGIITIGGGVVTASGNGGGGAGIGNGILNGQAETKLKMTGGLVFTDWTSDTDTNDCIGGILVTRSPSITHWYGSRSDFETPMSLTIPEHYIMDVPEDKTFNVKPGTTLTNNGMVIQAGSIGRYPPNPSYGNWEGNQPIANTQTHIDLSDNTPDTVSGNRWEYDYVTGVYSIWSGANVTVSGNAGESNRRIEVKENAEDVSITLTSDTCITNHGVNSPALSIGESAKVTLTMGDATSSFFTGGTGCAGIQVPGAREELLKDPLGGEDFIQTIPAATLTINGEGTMTTQGGTNGAGIGAGGDASSAGTLNMSGGIVFVSGLENNSNATTDVAGNLGILFDGATGTVFGDFRLPMNLEIPKDYTLTVPDSVGLTIPSQITLTNNGTVIHRFGAIINIYGSRLSNKFTPEVQTWPVASEITYGQQLSESVLTGGTASVEGRYSWAEDTTVKVPGGLYNAEFTPSSEHYEKLTEEVFVTVGKASVTNIGDAAVVTFAGEDLKLNDISGLFIIDSNAGTPKYSIEDGGTGEGSVSGNILTVTKAGTFIIGLTTDATENYLAGEKVTADLTVNKGTGAEVSSPTANSITETGFTAIAFLLQPTTEQSIEYAIGKNNTEPDTGWQNSGGFTDLTPWTEYYIFARSVGNAIYETGEWSCSAEAYRILDETPPEGEVEIGTNNWNSFWNIITFGLFFKNTQTVTVENVTDNSGQDVAIKYFLSEEIFETEEDLTAEALWITYPNDGIGINPNSKYVVYIKLTDLAGNSTYLNTAGVVIYTNSSAITTEITHVKLSGDKEASVNLNDNTIACIKNSSTLLEYGEDYTVNGNKIIFNDQYLDGLTAGTYKLYVSYNPMGVAYPENPEAGSEEPDTTTITLNIHLAGQDLALNGADNGYTYGAKPFQLSLSGKTNPTTETYEIICVEGTDAAIISEKTVTILKSGKFKIKATVPGDDIYEEATVTSDVITVSEAAPYVALEGNNVIYGQDVELKVTVSKPTDSSGEIPNGTVTFKKDGIILAENVSLINGEASYTDNTPAAGSYTYSVEYSGQAGFYTSNNDSRKIGVGRKDQTGFSITEPSAKTYGDDNFIITANGGQSGGAITFFAPDNNGVIDITPDGVVTILNAGTVIVKAVRDGGDNYNDAEATLELMIAERDISNVEIEITGSTVYTGTQLMPGFTVKDGDIAINTGDYSNAYGENINAGVQEGSVTLTGQRNYTGTKTIKFDIEKAKQTALNIAGGNITKTYGDGKFTPQLSGGSSGAGAVTWTSSHPEIVDINAATGEVTIKAATNGTVVTITVVKAGGSNYSDTSATATVMVNKKELTVTTDNKSRTYGAANPVFTILYSGFITGENENNALTTKPTASCTANAATPIGTAAITLSGGAAENYSFKYVAGTLTITAAEQTTIANTPGTGDNSSLVFWFLLGGAAMAVMSGMLVAVKKRRKHYGIKK